MPEQFYKRLTAQIETLKTLSYYLISELREKAEKEFDGWKDQTDELIKQYVDPNSKYFREYQGLRKRNILSELDIVFSQKNTDISPVDGNLWMTRNKFTLYRRFLENLKEEYK